ncbi:MAG: UDP-N-acetylmuramoyl-tripeptide--D-alanyl-D-alanine ligase [Thermodesulfobacteria bacterium]|nr:UDP-N-acetylmuramoyl-tripeptide--D-alanyl-D-alanine ligase [Thermodesulfobacteriota bacterium]
MNVANKFVTEDIVRAVNGILINGDMGIPFRGISTDSRTIKPGYLFWCLKGERFDGHDFWREAIDKGAKGLVISRFPKGFRVEDLPKTISVIFVKDTLIALGDLANFWRRKLNIPIIAITGSCGKTTTKEMTCAIVSNFWKCGKTPKNFNNLIGVPLAILSFKEGDVEVGIVELGTNAPGEIARLAEIVEPQIGIITCVAPSHLEGLGSEEGILKEKLSLFEKVKEDGILVYNRDQEVLVKAVEKFPHKKIAFGNSLEADVGFIVESVNQDEVKVKFKVKEVEREIELSNIGIHNLYNLSAGIAGSLALGIEPEKILEVVPNIELYTRSSVYKLGKVLLIDDAYNANPFSIKAALNYIKNFKDFPKKLAILGDMKELGKFSQSLHEEIGKLVSEFVDEAWFVGEEAKFYLNGYNSSKPYKYFKTSEECAEFIEANKEVFNEEMLVLVKGSRAVQLEKVVEKIKEVLS